MRPVNLIPAEQRRGARAPTRTGPLAYLVLAALGAVLLAVTALVVTGKQISDREAEVAHLEQEHAALEEKAASLKAFADFRQLRESRTDTVNTLAKSRFDWERVMRELSRVLPDDVWLVELTGTVTPEVQLETGADITVRDEVPGPALEIVGCATSQEAVGRFVAALNDIGGVTRVTAANSELPDQNSTAGGSTGAAAGSDDDCRTRDFIARFEIVAAFDEVPVDTATAAPAAPPAQPSTDAGASSDVGTVR